MTETTRTVLDQYQVRKTKKQKKEFIKWTSKIVEKAGYEVTVEKGLLGSRNIIIGNPEKAKVIFTAHYDTCAVLPFPNFITPKNFLCYLLYQAVLIVILTSIILAVTLLLYSMKIPFAPQVANLLLWVFVAFMLLGPANKHTANDNTSGVTTVLDIINKMPKDSQDKAAFILFDLEEVGLIGSFAYRLKHDKMIKDKLLINFDCVSDGNNILITVKRKAKHFIPSLKNAFTENENYSVEVLSRGIFFPSDQEMFPYGVAIATLKRSRFLNLLYMDRIHTKKDTVYQESNIDFLVTGAITLTKNID